MFTSSRILPFISPFMLIAWPVMASDAFVRPGNGIADNQHVWGHKNGLRIGIAPNPGPRGLIRIYAPYLDQSYPRVVNFLSIEPTVEGNRFRGQSELEQSRERPGKRGLTFRVEEFEVFDGGESARIFVHTEPFENGARPVVEFLFHHSRPYEIELVLHANEDSSPMRECVISATMGNFGLLRQLHLTQDRLVFAPRLWKDAKVERLGFYRWRSWDATQFPTDNDGFIVARATTNETEVDNLQYAPGTAKHWHYRGKLASHYWKAKATDRPIVAVNGRRTYWMSQSPIPGGIAFENFELRIPYRDGIRMWFGVEASEEK